MSEDVNILVESPEKLAHMDEARKRMRALYGENKRIEGDDYDRSLAVTCVNGTFVGKRIDGTGRAFDETFSRTLRRKWVQFATCGDPSLAVEDSPDGCAKAWPAYDLETRQVMVFDEDDIHVEPEPMRQIVDWERTYFLTRYYGI